MIRIDSGLSRRDFVALGMAGMAGLSLPALLEARARRSAKDTRVILIWLDGGPSHMDLYDMKPDAPPEYRGFWRPIPTNVPGMQISEMLPKQARVADKFSIVRSLHHDSGDHFAGAHIMLTGRWGGNGANPQGKYPSIGSLATAQTGPRRPGLPKYVSVPYASSVGRRPGYFGANYVGRHHDPFQTGGNPNTDKFKVQNLELPSGLTINRLESRRGLLKGLDQMRRMADATGTVKSLGKFEEQAYDLVTGPEVRRAFDISREDSKLRDRYGRNTWGQSMLLARRLAEAGVTFTTVHLGGWDNHWNLKEAMLRYLPRLDAGLAALYADLDSRGLLDETMVILCGEFSRTPKMNNGSGQGTPGRDHWGNSMFCLMSGGGLKGGRVVGATDARGERPVERLITPGDVHATIYHVLGVDPSETFLDPSGRPIAALDHGTPIRELI